MSLTIASAMKLLAVA